MYKCILYETNSRVRSMQTGINDDDDKSKKGIQDEPRGKLVDYHNPNVASKVIPKKGNNETSQNHTNDKDTNSNVAIPSLTDSETSSRKQDNINSNDSEYPNIVTVTTTMSGTDKHEADSPSSFIEPLVDKSVVIPKDDNKVFTSFVQMALARGDSDERDGLIVEKEKQLNDEHTKSDKVSDFQPNVISEQSIKRAYIMEIVDRLGTVTLYFDDAFNNIYQSPDLHLAFDFINSEDVRHMYRDIPSVLKCIDKVVSEKSDQTTTFTYNDIPWFLTTFLSKINKNEYGMIFVNLTEKPRKKQYLYPRYLRDVFNCNPNPILTVDSSLKITDFNLIACQFLGYDESELLKMSLDDLFIERDRDFIRNHTVPENQEDSSDTIVHEKFRSFIQNKNKYFVTVECILVSTSISPENKYYTAFIQDISNITKTEKRLASTYEISNALETIIDKAGIYLFAKDLNGNYISVNQTVKSHFPQFDFENLKDEEIFGSEYADAFKKIEHEVVKEHLTVYNEIQMKFVDDMRHFLATSTPRKDDYGKVIGMYSLVQDITEYKKAVIAKSEVEAQKAQLGEQLAQQSSLLKSEFLASMSHEIRTPLNGIIGMLTLLEYSQLNDQQRDCVQGIRTSTGQLLSIVNNILDFSKMDAGRISLEVNEIDINELVNDLQVVYSFTAKQKGLLFDIRNNIPVDKANIEGDYGRLRQVMANLLNNAVKFTFSGKVILVVDYLVKHNDPTEIVKNTFYNCLGINSNGHENDTKVNDSHVLSPTDGASKTLERYPHTSVYVADIMTHSASSGSFTHVEPLVRDFGKKSSSSSSQPSSQSSNASSNNGHSSQIVTESHGEQLKGKNSIDRQYTQDSQYHYENDFGEIHQERPMFMNAELDNQHENLVTPLDIKSEPDYILIQVIDTGIGIPQGKVNQLFKSFSQLDKSSTRQFDGTGLGLSICASLVKLMGGKIGVVSIHGHGSSFWFKIPYVVGKRVPIKAIEKVSPIPSVGEPSNENHVYSAGDLIRDNPDLLKKNVLVVEDNPMNRKVVVKLLNHIGFQVLACDNGFEALQLLQMYKLKFGLVLMDIFMPVMNGYEATREIRKLSPPVNNIAIVAMTANAIPDEREHVLSLGMDDYITKPVNVNKLYQVIIKWMDKNHVQQGPLAIHRTSHELMLDGDRSSCSTITIADTIDTSTSNVPSNVTSSESTPDVISAIGDKTRDKKSKDDTRN